jgi:trypsin
MFGTAMLSQFVLWCVLFFTLVTAASSAVVNSTLEDDRIVGGTEITISQAPYQVSLQYASGFHFCGGSIIGATWVMTAAHCTNGKTASQMRVRGGTSKYAKGGVIAKVSQVYQHPKYDAKTTDYDYSILKLAQRFVFNGKTLKSVALPTANETVAIGKSSFVTGWGATQNVSESNQVLRGAVIPIVDQAICEKNYEGFGGTSITSRMICAGYTEGGKDSCQGDSGGPLVIDNKLVGVVSWGRGCALANYPGVYSRVAYVRNWIRKITLF